jgi:osmotically-inducible protein OsmY
MALLDNPQFQDTEQSRQMLSNLALETDVRAALRADPRTSNTQIAITADKGSVTLAGMVDDDHETASAAEVAAKVNGVKDVKNLIRIATASRFKID